MYKYILQTFVLISQEDYPLKKLYIYTLLLLSITIICVLWFFYKPEPIESSAENSNAERPIKTTLLEAYKIGITKAFEYDEKAVLLHMNSIDDGEESGINGEKSTWQLLIALPSKNQRVGLTVKDQRITKTEMLKGVTTEYSIIKEKDIKVDSKNVVKKAISEFSLEPGGRKNYVFKGYQFKLIKEKGILFLTVVGNRGAEKMEIHYNGETGDYLGRIEG